MWLGPLTELRTPGLLPSPSRGQLAAFSVTEFGGLYGAGGIGSLTQPLLGERIQAALKPNRVAVVGTGLDRVYPRSHLALAHAIAQAGPLPAPSRGRVSRRVKSFPIAPRVSLKPDEKAQRWLLNISASDRLGLLYCIARVLAKHQIVVQLAKVATLGERVEDTFLIHGSQLQHNRAQIDIETEILDALAS